MAATGWRYFVPFQLDMERALDLLRQEVLTQGKYQEPELDLDFLDEVGFFEVDEDERGPLMAEYTLEPLQWAIDRFGLDSLREWLESQQGTLSLPRPRPRSMEELEALRCLSMDGTHSILDIGGISPEPDNGAITLLPEETLVKDFGTSRPTRDMVEAWQGRRDLVGESPFERDQGIYFTIYKDGQPDLIYIEGASGD